MSLLPAFRWLAGSWLGLSISRSNDAFAIIEMGHLIGLALLGGAVLITDLTALGLVRLPRDLARIERNLSPIALAGLATLLVSGFLLLADGPLRYYGNAAFRAKMALLAVAAVFYFTLHRRALRAQTSPAGVRTVALVSLTLWFAVALAGRAIGVL